MDRQADTLRKELLAARRKWPGLKGSRLNELRLLIQRYKFSVALGEITEISNHWYVTHSGLLQLASRRRCDGIETSPDEGLSDPKVNRWIFRAVVYKSCVSKGFVGYGDANPSNVASAMQGAELRIAETRAVNRALRKAYGIGICSVEELGDSAASNQNPDKYRWAVSSQLHSNNGQPRLRDQLST